MLVKSMKTLAEARNGALTAAYRAELRSRTYRTASLNTPTAPHEVIPVTTVDGARLRVHAYGPADGDVIVLIHGWSCSIEYWNPQINAFADRYRVVCYDQRGHGESQLGSVGPSAESLADDLSTVLDAALRRDQRAVLVGHSMGGMTLQAWAARYPEQVPRRAAAVVLLNTTSGNVMDDSDVLPMLNKPLTIASRPVTVFGAAVRLPAFIAETVVTTPVPLPGGWPSSAIFKDRVMSRGQQRPPAPRTHVAPDRRNPLPHRPSRRLPGLAHRPPGQYRSRRPLQCRTGTNHPAHQPPHHRHRLTTVLLSRSTTPGPGATP
jgi:pimeloyl-ACP methyl ester carboxylesterase